MQLTIDNLKTKYSINLDQNNKKLYEKNLLLMKNQIKQIENLVNEFSDFARMPKPLFKKNNLVEIIKSNVDLLKKIDINIKINFICSNEKIFFLSDYEQLSRVFLNLIKNSIESIHEKVRKTSNINKIIDIEIIEIRDYITINIIDDGVGFSNIDTKKLIKPYFTTKQKGTGLGLSIVNKIINDHNGSIEFINTQNGAKVKIILNKTNVS